MIDTLVLASRNKHKLRELRFFLDGLPIAVRGLDEFEHIGEIEEEGMTFADNALEKAREAHRLTGFPALADDSGLEVFYLNGRPGVRSARYSGASATDEINNEKLLREMKGVAPRRRAARFVAHLALIAPGVRELASGQCMGHVAEFPRGTNGFGYDPIFIPEGFDRTYAELSQDEKNQISHRSSAFKSMRAILERHTR